MTIPLVDLGTRLGEAKDWGRRPLVLSGGCSEVDTFFKYRIPDNLTIDSGTVFLKSKSELRSLLCSAMDYQGLCAPVLIKMASGAYDWGKFCSSDFPMELFSGALWTPRLAHEAGFISEGMLSKLGLEPTKWKDFHLIMSSDLSLDDAQVKLADKIPHYEKLAILAIDPSSIAQG